ncbi:MAG: hypothetical protein MZU95_06450 [Desulfomicrobium escambiense]|nr:hypothetical protein [Desulfomicrobium escambiense]
MDTSAAQMFTITDPSGVQRRAFVHCGRKPGWRTRMPALRAVAAWATADLGEGLRTSRGRPWPSPVSNDNNALFLDSACRKSPATGSSATRRPRPGGSATVTVSLRDNRRHATNGGVDTSAAQMFTITVNGVNDVPSFTAGANQAVNEDAGAQTVAAWATRDLGEAGG